MGIFFEKKLVLLSLLSGLILASAWFPGFPGMITFLGFVPLLYVEYYVSTHPDKYKSSIVLHYAFIAFAFWNLLSFWWAVFASWITIFPPVIINGFCMAAVFWLFHISKRRLGPGFGYAVLIFYWLAFEYIHHYWEFSFPWLTLGHAFARDIQIIQWYEYTGAMGGSAWVLLLNVLLFNFIKHIKLEKHKRLAIFNLLFFIFIFLIPVFISLWLFNRYEEKGEEVEIVIIQPNIDPYHEKYDYSAAKAHYESMMQLYDTLASNEVDYYLGPETAFPHGMWTKHLHKSMPFKGIKKFLKKYPDAKMIVGLHTYQQVSSLHKNKPEVRKWPKKERYFVVYNTAIQVDTSSTYKTYHKSKLVLGVERMPFSRLFPFLGKLAVDFGGITGTLGTSPKRLVFESKKAKVAPVICYEAIYGEFVSKFIKNNAEVIFVLSNDGWWRDTPGYKFLFHINRIRAIETRRSIARSANTGISGFINQKGEVLQQTGWWKRTAIRGKIIKNSQATYFTQHGHFIGRIAAFFAALFIIYTLVHYIIPKNKFW